MSEKISLDSSDIIIKNICIFVIGNGSGRFAATDEKGIR